MKIGGFEIEVDERLKPDELWIVYGKIVHRITNIGLPEGARMTAQELATKLDNSEYPLRVSPQVRGIAVAEGLLIIYGASDDLVEFDGAWTDEAGAYEGTTVRIDRTGIVPDFGEVEHEVSAVEEWVKRNKSAVDIEVLWCAEPGYSFTYKTDIPHATFEVVEDGEPYCRGIVIALSDLPEVSA